MRAIFVIGFVALAGCGSGVNVSDAVKLQNATAHLVSSGTCPSAGGALAPCATYQLTFAMQNGAPKAIDRVDDVTLATGGATLQNANAVGCATSPWTLPSGGASGVLEVQLSFGPAASLSIQCYGSQSIAGGAASASLLSAPTAATDSFDLRIEGLLSDAQPFVATAHAPIL
jgi:hypothetical protein